MSNFESTEKGAIPAEQRISGGLSGEVNQSMITDYQEKTRKVASGAESEAKNYERVVTLDATKPQEAIRTTTEDPNRLSIKAGVDRRPSTATQFLPEVTFTNTKG